MFSRSLCLCAAVGVLGLFSCSSNSGSSAGGAPESDDIVVAQGSGQACALPQGNYACHLNEINDQSHATFQPQFTQESDSQGRQIFSLNGVSYVADGKVHQANVRGESIQYSINCVGPQVELNSRSLVSDVGMRLKMRVVNQEDVRVSYLSKKNGNNLHARGGCSAQ